MCFSGTFNVYNFKIIINKTSQRVTFSRKLGLKPTMKCELGKYNISVICIMIKKNVFIIILVG